jgi:hypothetical protein
MMDATPLFDEPPHPLDPSMNKDYTRPVRPHPRSERPVRYYFIDFGEAEQYDPDNEEPRIELGRAGYGGDRSVPEFSTDVEYCNPFPVDVYRIGNIVRDFTDVSSLHLFCSFSLNEIHRETNLILDQNVASTSLGLYYWKCARTTLLNARR